MQNKNMKTSILDSINPFIELRNPYIGLSFISFFSPDSSSVLTILAFINNGDNKHIKLIIAGIGESDNTLAKKNPTYK